MTSPISIGRALRAHVPYTASCGRFVCVPGVPAGGLMEGPRPSEVMF